MTQQSDGTPVVRAFAEHVRAFHRGLPNEEKQLLERVFALADATNAALAGEESEAQGSTKGGGLLCRDPAGTYYLLTPAMLAQARLDAQAGETLVAQTSGGEVSGYQLGTTFEPVMSLNFLSHMGPELANRAKKEGEPKKDT